MDGHIFLIRKAVGKLCGDICGNSRNHILHLEQMGHPRKKSGILKGESKTARIEYDTMTEDW